MEPGSAGAAAVAGRRAHQIRQDTFDLRGQIHVDEHQQGGYIEEHSILEDSSDAEGEEGEGEIMMMDGDDNGALIDQGENDDMLQDDEIDYMSDTSSSLSIPNESIDFDLVYSLTNFAATVEGQASVVKGDSLFLMDDSNSYWWLVRVLKTQEVGYIPAENIETPFERLARLNRHRNVDLANPTEAEKADDFKAPLAKRSLSRNQARPRVQLAISGSTDSKDSASKRNVAFTPRESIYRYPPAVWNEEDEDADAEWDEDDIEVEERLLNDATAEEVELTTQASMQSNQVVTSPGMSSSSDEEDVAAITGATVPMQQEDTQMSWEELEDPRRPQQQQPQQQQLRSQTSRERLMQQQQQEQEKERQAQLQRQAEQEQATNRSQTLDPAAATETKKVIITPSVARDDVTSPGPTQPQQQGPLLPSAILAQQQSTQEQERKRAREEIEAAEEAARKRAATSQKAGPNVGPSNAQQQQPKELVRTASQETRSSISSSTSSGGGKLRKEPQRPGSSGETEDEKDGGKKKRGMFGSLFGRGKKDKDKGRDKGSLENIAAAAASGGVQDRMSEDSGLSSTHSHSLTGHTPFTTLPTDTGRGAPSPSNVRQAPLQQQQRTESPVQRASTPQQQQQTGPSASSMSPLASQLRERDQQQQAMYQQYLKRSPSSPPEQPSYGLQSAPAVMPTALAAAAGAPIGIGTAPSPNNSGYGMSLTTGTPSRPGGRPGSLILTSSVGGPDGQGVLPELSVIRVFAGKNLQSEATFKTVLLNSQTSASELVRQSMQRFRLSAGENADDYYLTVKQIEGTTMKLSSDDKPLGVFDQLVEEALELPKVKRSSMGSISSVASNLSAHPAIKKLPMNDFTDDSAVKFYLNRRRDDGEDSIITEEEDNTIVADSLQDGDSIGSGRGQYLTVQTGGPGSVVSPERYASPSLRFAMQIVIYPEELPDNMVFDPHTEAIVFKETLKVRSQSSSAVNPTVTHHQRKKLFSFPKNITVAEVIELGLERFGIQEGVVDGGDEVEDKLTKRRSSTRVRYILTVLIDGHERELTPSSKVVDAFPRAPTFRRSSEVKRRSIDSTQLLNNVDDVQPDDPVFVLRRAVTYRASAASRHRLSAPLDEIALNHLHRDSSASASSSGASSDAGAEAAAEDTKSRQPSRQEIIAAQRAAAIGNQKAMLSAQVNKLRGVDVMLPDRGMLRSQRLDVDNRMRYSYVQPDGETYDISELIEEELGGDEPRRVASPSGTSGGDLLNVVINGPQSGDGARLINRLLNKISEKSSVPSSSSSGTFRSTSPSTYSDDGQGRMSEILNSRSATPTASGLGGMRSTTPTTTVKEGGYYSSRSRSVTPTAAGQQQSVATGHHQPRPSIESVMSDVSVYRTATTNTPVPSNISSQPSTQSKRPKIPKGEFGLTEMLAIIESKASLSREPPPPPLDEVDRLFFGPKLDLETIHPQIRDVYSGTLKKMEELNNDLDELLRKSMHLF